ncbi:hypothetical protein ABBQ38_005977 [Trebouxia sp. C0009 RCD-2024]
MDGQDAVQDALAFLYRRMSKVTPDITSIEEAKRLLHFGHKYGVQVLLAETDIFIHQWCKKNFSTVPYADRDSIVGNTCSPDKAVSAVHKVVEWSILAEGAGLQMTLGLCKCGLLLTFGLLRITLGLSLVRASVLSWQSWDLICWHA